MQVFVGYYMKSTLTKADLWPQKNAKCTKFSPKFPFPEKMLPKRCYDNIVTENVHNVSSERYKLTEQYFHVSVLKWNLFPPHLSVCICMFLYFASLLFTSLVKKSQKK